MSDPFWLFKGPFMIATCGAAFLFAGAVWTVTGKAWDRYRGWVRRAEKPGRFWGIVATYYLCGTALIWVFWLKVHSASN